MQNIHMHNMHAYVQNMHNIHTHLKCILQQKQVPAKENWSEIFNNIELLVLIFCQQKRLIKAQRQFKQDKKWEF